MDRKEFILKCMLAYDQYNPAPADVKTAEVRPMTTKPAQSRYENVAAYIDRQLTLAEN